MNGVFKSTLIKLFFGIHPHGNHEGEPCAEGRLASHRNSPSSTNSASPKTFFWGALRKKALRIDWQEMDRSAAILLPDFGLDIFPHAPVAGELPLLIVALRLDASGESHLPLVQTEFIGGPSAKKRSAYFDRLVVMSL